jgi:biopolymer transport protein ExbD
MKLRKRRATTDIPLASMGDIAFLLMIFYMATTLVTDQKPWEVPLPEVTGRAAPSPYPLVIYLDKDLAEQRSVYFFNEIVPIGGLAEKVRFKGAGAPDAVRLYLNIQRDLPFRYMNEVINALKRAGIRNLVITTAGIKEKPDR